MRRDEKNGAVAQYVQIAVLVMLVIAILAAVITQAKASESGGNQAVQYSQTEVLNRECAVAGMAEWGMTELPLRSFFRRLSKLMNYTATPHRFRHTVATNLMRSPDRNIKHVQMLLGHSSLQSTMEYIEDDMDFLGDVMQEEIRRRRKKG